MPTYTVLSGTHRREDGSVAEAGDTVEMSEEQRDRFSLGKFEEVEQPEDAVESAATADEVTATISEDLDEPEDEADDEPDAPEASDEIPDDWDMVQAMAVVYEGDEVKGNMSQEDIEAFFASELTDTELIDLKQQARDHLYAEPDDA